MAQWPASFRVDLGEWRVLLGDLVELNARRFAADPAIVSGERQLTWAELDDRRLRLANALTEFAAPGDRVAILAENVPEYFEAYYGVTAAGMVLTFLNYRLHPRELAWIMNDAQATVLLCHADYLPALESVRSELATVRHVVVIGGTPGPGDQSYEELLAGASSAPCAAAVSDDDVAWLIYTSGTTGRPKGAMLTHRNIVASMWNGLSSMDYRSEDRILVNLPLCHVSGTTITAGHLPGSRVVLMPAFDPALFCELVQEHRITSTAMAPTMMNFLLQYPKIDDYDLSSLRLIGYGASSMPLEVCRAAMKRFGPVLYQAYGMTETAGPMVYQPIADHVRAVEGEAHLLAATGRPLPMGAVRVVDDAMTEVPDEQVGEIVVWGDQVFRGYWRNDEATTSAFAGGWFHTGDMARRDKAGYLYLVDRKKDMIVTGGENVYSREVEEVIYTHPAVSEVAVIGLPDPTWGENVCAVVVIREGMQVTEAEIVDVCRARLAGYKKPKSVVFVQELPKTTSGKILKRDLRLSLANSQSG